MLVDFIYFCKTKPIMTQKNISKLGFSDLLKSSVNLNSGNIKENKSDFSAFASEIRQKQVDILKSKDLNDSQLKIVIKL